MTTPRFCLRMLIIAVFSVQVAGGAETTPYKQLAMDLMNNYGPRNVRPVKQHNTTMELFFRAKPVWFSDFDERKQVLTFVSLNKYQWTDEYLTWNPSDYDGIKEIHFSKDQIWFPDITALERIGTESEEVNIEKPVVTVNFKGVAIYYHQAMLSAFCKMNVRLFPYDTHACTISYTMYSYTNDEAELFYARDSDAQEDTLQKNGVWSIAETKVEEAEVKYLCCPLPYKEVHVTMYIRRESGFYVLNVGLPTFLLSLTTLSVFLLHPESGEKISLCVNNVLALIIFQQLLVLSMPPTGDNTPVVALYFVLMICISFLSVLTTCLTLGIYHSRATRPFPHLLKRLLFMKLTETEKEATTDAGTNVFVNDGVPHDWVRLEDSLRLSDSLSEDHLGGDRPDHHRGRRRSSGSAKRERDASRRNIVGTTSGLVPINITGNGVTDAAIMEGTFELEWKEAAIRIDIFLFILSLSAMILTTIYCMSTFFRVNSPD